MINVAEVKNEFLSRKLPEGVELVTVFAGITFCSQEAVTVALYHDTRWGDYRLVTEFGQDTNRRVITIYDTEVRFALAGAEKSFKEMTEI